MQVQKRRAAGNRHNQDYTYNEHYLFQHKAMGVQFTITLQTPWDRRSSFVVCQGVLLAKLHEKPESATAPISSPVRRDKRAVAQPCTTLAPFDPAS